MGKTKSRTSIVDSFNHFLKNIFTVTALLIVASIFFIYGATINLL